MIPPSVASLVSPSMVAEVCSVGMFLHLVGTFSSVVVEVCSFATFVVPSPSFSIRAETAHEKWRGKKFINNYNNL